MNTNTKTKEELRQAFWSAKSVEEMLQALKDMDASFIDYELGSEFLAVARKSFQDGNDLEQVLTYAKKAFLSFQTQFLNTTDNHDHQYLYSLSTTALCILGGASFDLLRYDDSLGFLNQANKYLSKLDDGNEKDYFALYVQIQLRNAKAAMGEIEEVIVDSKKILEMRVREKEKAMDEGCCDEIVRANFDVEIGRANSEVALSCINAYDHEQALLFCLKALDIFEKCLGRESVEAAQVLVRLTTIYLKMGNYDKALERNGEAIAFLKKESPGSLDYLSAVTDGAITLTLMGRYQEAIVMLKDVVPHGGLQVKFYVAMARALLRVGRLTDAKKYAELAQKELEKETFPIPMFLSTALADLSVLYHEMNDCKTAVSLLTEGLKLPGVPLNLVAHLSALFMSLKAEPGEREEEVAYMKKEVGELEASFGPEHCVVGYGYSNLGDAYLKSGQKDLGAESLVHAKAIFDASLGNRHLTSLKSSHSLSVAYGTLKRYQEAFDIEKKVIQDLQGLKPSAEAEQFLLQVIQHLNDMDDKIKESRRRAASQSKEKDLSSKVSQCSISDD